MYRRYGIYVLMVASVIVLCSMKVYAKDKYSTKGITPIMNYYWDYDKKSKTLTIRPASQSKRSKHTHDLMHWCDKAQHVVYKKGVMIIDPAFDNDEYYNNLKSVEFGENIHYINDDAFGLCESLESITFKGNIEYLGDNAFAYSSIKNFTCPKGIKYIGQKSYPKEGSVVLNDGLEYIGYEAFKESAIKRISIPESVKYIGPRAFFKCKSLSEVELPNNLKVVEHGIFYKASALKKCTIPDSVVAIEPNAFSYTSIEEITIPANVECLGGVIDKSQYLSYGKGRLYYNTDYYDNDFYQLDEDEDFLYGAIFTGCSQLKRIRFETKKLNKVYEEALYGLSDDVVIEVPRGCKEKYKELFYNGDLKELANIVEVDIESEDENVRLNKTNITAKAGCVRQLELMCAGDIDNISWDTTDAKVATVDNNGVVTGIDVGECDIIAHYKAKDYVCKYSVTSADVNDDANELKKLIATQKGNKQISTDINSSQYKWKNGRLIGINWDGCGVSGILDLNGLTCLEYICIGRRRSDHALGKAVICIEADDLKNLRTIGCENCNFYRKCVHTANSIGLTIVKKPDGYSDEID